MEEARFKVACGADALNLYFAKPPEKPYWYSLIDLNALDQSNSHKCVVAQAVGEGHYGDGIRKLGLNNNLPEAIRLGFIADHNEDAYQDSITLSKAWREYLQGRIDDDEDRRNMSWARHYVELGCKLVDAELGEDWYKLDEDIVEDLDDPYTLMGDIRLLVNGHTTIDPYDPDDSFCHLYGFEEGKNATSLQLAQAWAEIIRERITMSERCQVEVNMGVESEGLNELYIVLNGPYSVGLVTDNLEEATSWINALESVGTGCELVTKQIGRS
jgi:hypothetical protein